jgi:trk system potassium uptake protein TrkH
LGDAVVLLKYILIFTLSVEIIGALLLYLHGLSPHRWENLFYAIFHSISAFCNAGFSLFKDSLVGYKNDFLINFTITALIIIGGIGFIVITEIRNLLTRGGFKKVSLHTKVVLLISFLLILIATFAFFLLENHNTLTGLQTWEKLQASYFQAVTPRTAGFNTIPIEEMTNASLFFTIILMFIGGSSGSTAGGIKTATLAVLIGMILMNFRGGERIELFKKTIPNDIGQKALSIVLLSLSLIIFSTMVLVITESGSSFMEILFEVVSAFGTVGLSCGLTTKLSILGKLLIIATMFIGRIGPLTLALAIGERKSPGSYKYSEEKVFVG